MLDDSVIDLEDPRPYMAAPPVRSRAHVEAVWRALADGTLDTLGSDHHEGAYQPPGTPENFTGVGYSIRGLRVRLPMLLGEGLRRGVAIEHLVELLCGGPARVFGLPGKGRLAPGCDADVVIWDPKGSWQIGPDYPAWNGRTVPGAVRTVLRRGETVVRDGELLEPRTTGRHLPRRFTASRHHAVRMA
jgi:dihydropyrimidinase